MNVFLSNIIEQKKCHLVLLFILFFSNSYAISDTVKLYFQLSKYELSTDAKHTIDSLIYYEYIKTTDSLLIVGYADYLGTDTYNDTLSNKRADMVKDYLLRMGTPMKRIALCVGRGEVSRPVELPEGYAPDRRVDLIINPQLIKPQPTVPKPKIVSQPNKLSIKRIPDSTENGPKDFSSININELEIGETFVLNNIYFYTGMHTVKEESFPELRYLLQIMQEHSNLKIKIEGHVCCISPTAPDALDEGTLELALSTNRAKAIYFYLKESGIDAERMRFEGFGKTRPRVKKEVTEADAQANRRVEIRITDK